MVEGQEDVTWQEWRALAAACEEHGLEGLFRSDHYVSVAAEKDRGSLDAWTVIAGLAAVTSRIRLGTMVSPATFRHPSLLAKAVVTADHISGGRVELGMGAGWYEREHRAYGFPFPGDATRIGILQEQVEIVHRQWTEEEVSFRGRHYVLDSVRALPKPLQDPHPPLVVGGYAGPRAVALAARWADGYNLVSAPADDCADARRRLEAAWRDAGRDPGSVVFSLMTGCVVGRDAGEVDERIAAVQRSRGAEPDPAAFRAQKPAWIVGTVDEVVERLRTLEKAGVDRVMLQHLAHRDLEMVEVLGRDVAPAAAG